MTDEPHSAADYEDYGGLTDRHISIEDAMRVKVAMRLTGRKKRDTERARG